MFARTRYLEWARRLYGQVAFDLATSGTRTASWPELGVPMPAIDDPQGYARLREKIAHYNQVTTAEAVPALGTSGALFLAYAATSSPGDEVLVESPGYEPLTRAAEGTGAVVRTFPRLEAEGFAVDPSRVAARVTARTRVIAVSDLHNPSGVRLPREVIAELAAIAEARGAYLLVDEVYAPFDDLPEDGVFRGSARHVAPNVVAVGSLTKAYGLGMHRIGWVLGPPAIIAAAEDALVATTGHLPLPHACLGAAAFDAVGTLAKRAKGLLAGKRAIAADWARSNPRVRWSAPDAGLFGLVTVPGATDLVPRIEALAKTTGVLVAPGAFFDAPESFRLSWASLDEARFREALGKLGPLLG